MMQFLLVVESENVRGVGDRVLHKQCEWYTIPRIGERLVLEGNTHEVHEVDHDLGKSRIEIYVRADDDDFDRLLGFEGYTLVFEVAVTNNLDGSPLLDMDPTEFFSSERFARTAYSVLTKHKAYNTVRNLMCEDPKTHRSITVRTMREFINRYPNGRTLRKAYGCGQRTASAIAEVIVAAGIQYSLFDS